MGGAARVLSILAVLAVVALALWGGDGTEPHAARQAIESDPGEAAGPAPGLSGRGTERQATCPTTAAEGDAAPTEAGPTYAIEGRVIDANEGTGVPGVSVFFFQGLCFQRFRSGGRTVSGPDGSYRMTGLQAEEGGRCVVAMGAGWISSEIARARREFRASVPVAEAVSGETFRLDLRVVRAAHLEGRVLLPDGAPAAGAEVRGLVRTVPPGVAMMRRFTAEDLIAPVRTDAEGCFVIPTACASETLQVEARVAGYAWTRSSPVETVLGRGSHVEIHLPPPRRAVVQVVSAANDNPIGGATVRTRRVRAPREYGVWDFEDPTDLVRTTDARGRAALAPLPPEPVRISVEAKGFQRYRSPTGVDAVRDVLHAAAGGAGRAATIRLEPAGVVAGRLLLPDGVPPWMFCVSVRAVDAPGHERLSRIGLVDPETGTFRVELPRTGLYQLEASGEFEEGFYGAVTEVRPGDVGLEIRVALEGIDTASDLLTSEPEGPVSWWDVAVVGPEGRLVKRVWLSVMPPDAESDLYGMEINPQLAYRGTEGRYRVPVRPDTKGVWLEADYVVLADGTTGAPRMVGPLDGGGGKMTVRLERAGSISGTVLGTDGKPLQGQRVLAVQADPGGPPEDGYLSTGFSEDARTDANGRFTVRGLAPVEHVLWLRPQKGLVPQAPVRASTGQTDVVLRTKPAVSALVTVADADGAPVYGARVDAWIKEDLLDPGRAEALPVGVTDDAGQCRLDGLDDAATYVLHVRVRSGRDDLDSTRVDGWRPEDTTIVLARMYSLGGWVQTPGGEGLEGALVTLRVEGGNSRRVRSGPGGSFSFGRLEKGSGHLRATWHQPGRDGALLGPASEEQAVSMGDQGIVLRLSSGRDLMIHIENANSRWGLGRRVRVSPIDGPRGARTWLDVDDQGRVLCRGLEPGRGYYVWFGPTETGRYAYGTVGPEQDSVALPARKGGEVQVQVTWPDGAETKEVYLTGPGFHLDGQNQDSGGYRIRGVPPGTWRVTASARLAGRTLSTERSASAGEAVVMEVRVP